MTKSHGRCASAARMFSSVSTRWISSSYPPRRNSRISNAASRSESSTSSKRNTRRSEAAAVSPAGGTVSLILRVFAPALRGGLVQHEPVQSDLSHRLRELGEVDGLANIAVRAETVPFHH